MEFIHKIHSLNLDENDIIVSYDVVYRFTKIHVLKYLNLISKMVDVDTLNLLEIGVYVCDSSRN